MEICQELLLQALQAPQACWQPQRPKLEPLLPRRPKALEPLELQPESR